MGGNDSLWPIQVTSILFSVSPKIEYITPDLSHMLTPLSHTQQTAQYDASHPHPFFKGSELSKDRNWSDSELVKLSSFMLYHREKFQGEKTRKEAKVFSMLSKFIKSRNVNQCRNYVHKLLAKFKDYDQIIQFFRESIPSFQTNYARQVQQLERIGLPLKIKEKGSNNARQIPKGHIEDQIKELKCMDHIEMKPTDVSYCDQPENHPLLSPKNHQQPSHSSPIPQRQRSQPSINHSRILDQSYFCSQPAGLSTQQQKKWKDCHEMFITWTSKATKLLQRFEKSHAPVAYP